MNLLLLRFLAMTIGPAITSAARPAATFWAVQIIVIALISRDLASLPDAMQWLISNEAFMAGGVLAGLETVAKHDSDITSIWVDLSLDKITGALGAFSAALLFAALGMPEVQATALIDTAANPDAAANLTATSGLLSSIAPAAAFERSFALQAGIITAAVTLNLGLTWLRSQLLEFIDDFNLGGLWAKLETGGVVGVLVLLPFLPLIAFGFIILFTLLFSALAIAGRTAKRAADQRARVACETCGYKLRAEASLCVECKTERAPTQDVRTGLYTALNALRHRSDLQKRDARA